MVQNFAEVSLFSW